MFFINLKIAFRNLWKHKGFSAINIGGLAIGMACCLILLLYVNYEWSYDKQFKDIDRIYYSEINLNVNGKLITTQANPNKLAAAAQQSLPGVESTARIAFSSSDKLFSHDENRFKLNALSVDPSFLRIFDYTFISGSAETALNTPEGVLLTASTAKKLFGAVNPMGQLVKWNNKRFLKVTAVVADLPDNQSIKYDALTSWSFFDSENPDDKNNGWGSITCATLIKLKDKRFFESTDLGLRRLIKENEKDTQLEAFLFPFSKQHLYGEFENGKSIGGKIDQVRLFAFLAFCVLLIASINYMNLSTARSEKRAREVGVRKALGSSRKTLMGQFILESMLFSSIAILLAFTLLELALPYFNNLLGISIGIAYNNVLFWLTLLGMALITGLLAGSYPAFYLSSFMPVKVLKGFNGSGRSSLSIRKILVVLQFSLSICMIVCAIIVYSQIQFIKQKPLGFAQDNLVQLDLEGELEKPEKLKFFKDELIRSGAISSATEFAQSFSSSGSITGNFSWPGKDANDKSIVSYRSVGFDFTNTVGVKVLAGRDFSRQFRADTATSLLVNQSMVKHMGLKNPVGTVVHWGENPPLTIIGVVDDYYNEKAGKAAQPTFFFNNASITHVLLMRLSANQAASLSIDRIKEVNKQLNPGYPGELTFVSSRMEEHLKTEHLLSVLSNLFGGFAIFISCLGLLGLALYMAEQRKKEISIRKVLGADLRSILILLNLDFMKLVLLSNIIAFPVAFVLIQKWLKNYDYKIAIGAWPFLIAGLLSLVIAGLTVSLQSFKVAKANAVDALKYE
ncbi:ABC transporter permease [Pedobacter duraquae]|uniref:ABC-type antimicrobial peptide transport system permease subunit n=1 Tax=Pedobacter duraquae TaxID=425511 RepID=A0A4R6IPT6_9SPHI|nr:ABC transporter permease [Pedobacter duraquae]TDO23965.1 ABC-type antimicrobial peptide transport system permease subunit [Pedobacter duraquae]